MVFTLCPCNVSQPMIGAPNHARVEPTRTEAAKMKICFAEKSEAEAIGRFVSELAMTHVGPTLSIEGLENLLRSMDAEATIARMADGFPHWVALEDGAIVGVAVVQPPSHLYHPFVHSDRQRTGIGRRLMNEALRFVSDRCGSAPLP